MSIPWNSKTFMVRQAQAANCGSWVTLQVEKHVYEYQPFRIALRRMPLSLQHLHTRIHTSARQHSSAYTHPWRWTASVVTLCGFLLLDFRPDYSRSTAPARSAEELPTVACQ